MLLSVFVGYSLTQKPTSVVNHYQRNSLFQLVPHLARVNLFQSFLLSRESLKGNGPLDLSLFD